MNNIRLLIDAIATGKSAPVVPGCAEMSFEADGITSAGSGAATIDIYGSNLDNPDTDVDGVSLGQITLVLATTKSQGGFGVDVPWKNVWADISAISGTDATVNVRMAVHP